MKIDLLCIDVNLRMCVYVFFFCLFFFFNLNLFSPLLWSLPEGCSPPSWVQAAVKPGLAASRIICTVMASQIKTNKKQLKKIVTYGLIMFCIFLGRNLKRNLKIFVTETHGNILGGVWLDIHSILLDLFFPSLFLLCTIDRIQAKDPPSKSMNLFLYC